MSCFIVDKGTIDIIITCYRENSAEWQSIPFWSKKGQNLQNLNLEAYKTRYPNEKDLELEPYQFTEKPASKCQVLKSLQCFLYQCSESNDLINSPLFKELEAETNNLAFRIVEQLPEYNQAKWD